MRTFNTVTITPYGFEIRHNLTGNEFKAICHKWRLTSPTHSQVSLIHLINHYSDKGWKAFDPADIYWNIEAYSNSRLGSIRNQLLNRIETPSRSVFVFGTAFHELLLQPEIVADARDYYLSNSQLGTVLAMVDRIKDYDQAVIEARGGEIERIFTWTDTETGLPCKAKVDSEAIRIHAGSRVIYDVKTTSATNEDEFAAAITKYDYLRQAAFYLDGTGAELFTWIGVSKRKPFEYFITSQSPQSEEIQEARVRYKFILQKALELGIQP